MKVFLKRGKILFLVMVMLCSVILSAGCGFKDIDKRIFIVAIGLDYTKNDTKPYRVILKLAIPSGTAKDSTGPRYTYLTKESATLAEAVRILKTHIDKELDFGQAKMIVLGENLLHRDMEKDIDFFLRRRDIQFISWMAIGRPTAEKVLKTEPSSEMAGSNALFNIFSGIGTESGYIITTYLFDFRRRLLEPGMDAIVPIIETNKKKTKFIINKAVVFKNHKEKVELTADQTKDYNTLSGNAEKVDVKVKKKGLDFALSVDTVKVKYKILTPANKAPVLKMDIKMEGIVEESKDRLPPSNMDTYSKYASELSKKRLTAFLKMLQKNQVDPLGFGLRYQATHLHTRDTYAEWKQIYPHLKFDVSVKTTVKSVGTVE